MIANSGIIPAYVDDNVKSIISGLDGIPRISLIILMQISSIWSSHFIQTLVS